jgi:hypothetical protein
MVLKRQKEFDLKRIKAKKKQKQLQAMALEQDIQREERKVYKKFIKY